MTILTYTSHLKGLPNIRISLLAPLYLLVQADTNAYVTQFPSWLEERNNQEKQIA